MISRDSVIAIEDGLLIVCYDHTPGGQIVSVTVSRVFGPKDTSFSSRYRYHFWKVLLWWFNCFTSMNENEIERTSS